MVKCYRNEWPLVEYLSLYVGSKTLERIKNFYLICK